MKIIAIDAIDIKSFGGLVHLNELIQTLSKKNIVVKIFSNSFVKKNIRNKKKIKIISKNIYDKNYIIRYLWKIFFFNKILKQNKCNLLLCLNGVYHGLFKPTLLVNQNILPFDNFAKNKYNFFSKLKFSFQKIALLISIKLHKNVIFTSYDFKNRIMQYFKNKKKLNVKVIYHGVRKGIKINKKDTKKNNIKLLFVSSFEKYKNHNKLFEAIEKDKEGRIELTCIGGNNFSDLKRLNAKYNLNQLKINIIKCMSYDKIFANYKNYDGLIFPSLAESFGLPVLEASINKIPILCSDLKVFKEIFKDGCFYFNPNNSKSILDKINYFKSLKKNKINEKIKKNYNKAKKLNLNYFGKNYYNMIIKTLYIYEKKK